MEWYRGGWQLSISPSLFHSRLKTYLFHKSFPPYTPFQPQDWLHGLHDRTVSSEHLRFFLFLVYSLGLFFFWFRAADLAGYPSAFRRTPSYRIASVHMHCVCNTVQLLWHDRLPFSWTMPPPTAPSWTHWLQHLWSHTAAWVWIASQKDWRNQGAPGSTMAMHWYSIWLIKCAFSCFSVLPGSAEAHVIWGGTVNHRFRLWYSRICAEKGR